jgi:hypothetical protein
MRQTDALATKLLDRLRAANLPLQLVAAFTKAQPGTVGDWLSKGQPPRGDRLNRLQHLLALLGIESPELSLVPDFGRYLGRLMAFDALTFAEARAILGGIHDQAVFQTIRGERDPFSEDAEKKPTKTLEQLQEEYSEGLSAAEDKTRRQFAEQGIVVTTATQPSPVLIPQDGDEPTQGFILRSACAISGILPLMRCLASDRCTPEDRAELREYLGEEGMFELSTLANQLCGERARSTTGR